MVDLSSGYGTIMFDGWQDVNFAPVVNVLIRTISTNRTTCRTYFVGMVHTGSEACTAQKYVRIVEEVMEEYGGMDRVAGVVTDNTSSCRVARDTLESKYPHLVASQDQAHVADLLMKDIGDIQWVEEALETVAPISSVLRSHPKMHQRVRALVDNYNREVAACNGSNEVSFGEVPYSADDPYQDPGEDEEQEPEPLEEILSRQRRAQQRAMHRTAV